MQKIESHSNTAPTDKYLIEAVQQLPNLFTVRDGMRIWQLSKVGASNRIKNAAALGLVCQHRDAFRNEGATWRKTCA